MGRKADVKSKGPKKVISRGRHSYRRGLEKGSVQSLVPVSHLDYVPEPTSDQIFS